MLPHLREHLESELRAARRAADYFYQQGIMKVVEPGLAGHATRYLNLARTHFENGRMWLGLTLGAIDDKSYPYPDSLNPENCYVHPAADSFIESEYGRIFLATEVELVQKVKRLRTIMGENIRAVASLRIMTHQGDILENGGLNPYECLTKVLLAFHDSKLALGMELQDMLHDKRGGAVPTPSLPMPGDPGRPFTPSEVFPPTTTWENLPGVSTPTSPDSLPILNGPTSIDPDLVTTTTPSATSLSSTTETSILAVDSTVAPTLPESPLSLPEPLDSTSTPSELIVAINPDFLDKDLVISVTPTPTISSEISTGTETLINESSELISTTTPAVDFEFSSTESSTPTIKTPFTSLEESTVLNPSSPTSLLPGTETPATDSNPTLTSDDSLPELTQSTTDTFASTEPTAATQDASMVDEYPTLASTTSPAEMDSLRTLPATTTDLSAIPTLLDSAPKNTEQISSTSTESSRDLADLTGGGFSPASRSSETAAAATPSSSTDDSLATIVGPTPETLFGSTLTTSPGASTKSKTTSSTGKEKSGSSSSKKAPKE